jgi:phosphatidate cytidylyltransferase
VSLPHWTEPPSGEHPRIRSDSAAPGEDDELAPWSSLSAAPRWRDQPTDWEATDYDEGMLDDGESRLGALLDDPADDDDDFFGVEEAPPPPRRSARPRGGATQVRTRARRPPAPDEPPGPPTSGSSGGDVGTRVITGLGAAGVLLVAAMIGPGALVLLVAVAVVLATAELFQALRTRGYQPATLLGLAASAGAVTGAYWRGEQAFGLVLALLVVFTLLWYLLGVVKGRPTMNVAVTVLAFLYVGFLGSYAALLLKYPSDHGIGLLLGAVLATVAFDVGSFFGGRSMGKTLLAPDISPNKTVEGLVSGCVLTLLVCLAVVGSIEPWDIGKAFWLFVVVCPAALFGDLCESLIKRDLGVKDMGTILPGHGGVLDRIDALLFVVPATYYLVRLLDVV